LARDLVCKFLYVWGFNILDRHTSYILLTSVEAKLTVLSI
jgi:hypothetical protein